MPFITRETIDAALYALVDVAVGKVAALKTSSRRMVPPMSVTPEMCPALYMIVVSEQNDRGPAIGLPVKRTRRVEFALYTADPQEDTVVQTTQLNAMIDAIQDAFEKFPPTGATTNFVSLGGIVAVARIAGNVEYFARLTDGKSAAVVPVEVILP